MVQSGAIQVIVGLIGGRLKQQLTPKKTPINSQRSEGDISRTALTGVSYYFMSWPLQCQTNRSHNNQPCRILSTV